MHFTNCGGCYFVGNPIVLACRPSPVGDSPKSSPFLEADQPNGAARWKNFNVPLLSVTLALNRVTSLAAVTPVLKRRSQGQMERCPKLPAPRQPWLDHQKSHMNLVAFAIESSWLCHLSLGFGRQSGSMLPKVAL